MFPKVSVIIPVFNSAGYVREAVRSVQEQSIEPDSVEIIAVDDGSTDGSGEVLAELAADDSRLTVITQENSGSPGGGRNPAIGQARGEFVFFLDSDDLLTPDALRRMVEVATDENSDVVLGRMASTDKRHAPASMFSRTVLDADLVRDKVFNTLGPTKLIRREIIERLGLRFPEDQKVGEDQPFMAAVYLSARKISVLSDMDYYLIRYREDGSNLTLSSRTSESHIVTAQRLASTIEEYTSPGELRDALMKRPFGWSMRRALDRRWPRLDRSEQQRLADGVRSGMGHLYTDGVRKALAIDARAMLDLLMAGDLEGLEAYAAHLASGAPRRTAWRDGSFVRQLPSELEHLVPLGERIVGAPKMACRLEDVRVNGQDVTVAATVRIADFDGGPERLGLRARLRDGEAVEEFAVTSVDLEPRARSSAITAAHGSLGRGVWDMFVVVGFGDLEQELRLGAERSRTIAPEGVSNLALDPLPQDRVVAYFTQGPGNLSIDQGAVLHRKVAKARALGLTVDENGRALLLVETSTEPRTEDEYFAHVDDPDQHGGRQLLPAVRLGDRLLALRLPLSASMVGVTTTFTAVLGGVSSPLPVSGAAHWPARASGFGLAETGEGGIRVTAASGSGRSSEAFTQARAAGAEGRKAVAQRLAPVVKRLPLIGPALTRAVRATRERRS